MTAVRDTTYSTFRLKGTGSRLVVDEPLPKNQINLEELFARLEGQAGVPEVPPRYQIPRAKSAARILLDVGEAFLGCPLQSVRSLCELNRPGFCSDVYVSACLATLD